MNSLYKQVSNNILEQIAAGQLQVGDRLPPENDFAIEIGVSRSTLRLAFDELESVGVLSRRKRIGTIIIADEPTPKISIPIGSMEAGLKFLQESVFKVEKVSTVNATDVSRLEEIDSNCGQWLELYGWRAKQIDLEPVCSHHTYVPECFSDIDVSENDVISSAFTKIKHKYSVPLARIRHVIAPLACPDREAITLGLVAGQPVLQGNTSLYTKNDKLMAHVTTVYHPRHYDAASEYVFE